MFDILTVVAVSRELHKLFQSLAHQASVVPTQKLKLPATNNKLIKCRKASHIDGASRMYVMIASCAAAKLPEPSAKNPTVDKVIQTTIQWRPISNFADQLPKVNNTMICTYCNNPIVLQPSAEQRSKATGKPASYFTGLFTMHSKCQVVKRNADAVALMQRTAKG